MNFNLIRSNLRLPSFGGAAWVFIACFLLIACDFSPAASKFNFAQSSQAQDASAAVVPKQTLEVVNPHYTQLLADGDQFILVGSEGSIRFGDFVRAPKEWISARPPAAAHGFLAVAQSPQGYVAVGEQGQIFVSEFPTRPNTVSFEDKSKWRAVTSPVTSGLRRVIIDSKRGQGFALGDSGELVAGALDAQAWTHVQSLGVPVRDLRILAGDVLFAVGEAGFRGYSEDGGASWQTLAQVPDVDFRHIFASGRKVLVVAERRESESDADNLIHQSPRFELWVADDSLDHWQVAALPVDSAITDLAFDETKDELRLTTAAGEIWRGHTLANASHNNQSLWHWQLQQTTEDFLARIVHLPHQDQTSSEWLAIGNSGRVWLDAGDGQWRLLDSGVTANLNTLALDSRKQQLVIAGESGALLRFDVASSELHTLTVPVSGFVQDFAIAENGDYLAIGSQGLLVQSSDGGQHWQPQSAELDTGDYLFSLAQSATGTWVAAGPPGTIIRRDANTQSWHLVLAVNDASRAYFQKILFGGKGMALAIAGPGDSYWAKDEARYWQPLLIPDERQAYNGLYSDFLKRFVVVGQAGLVALVTEANGWVQPATFTAASLQALVEVPLPPVQLMTRQAGARLISATHNGEIWWSDDGGTWWQRASIDNQLSGDEQTPGDDQASNNAPVAVMHLLALPETSVVLGVGLKGGVVRSSDRGETWQKIKASAKGNLRAPLLDATSGHIYVPSRSGEIMVSRDGGLHWQLLVGVPETSIKGLALDNARDQLIAYGERLLILPRPETWPRQNHSD